MRDSIENNGNLQRRNLYFPRQLRVHKTLLRQENPEEQLPISGRQKIIRISPERSEKEDPLAGNVYGSATSETGETGPRC